MRHFSVKAQAAKHAGKTAIYNKTINQRSLTGKNHVKSFIRLFRNFCSQCETISRAAGNDSKIEIKIHKASNDLAYCTITTGNNDVCNFFISYFLMQK